MGSPKISVLVPMYNCRDYIAQCLDSALNQTFREDYEIIVRDDGSSDGSADFVEQRYAAAIASGKLKLRRNEKNLGEHHTENRLFLDATGKYFAVLHNDDIYLPHALEHMYEVAEYFKADVVHSCGTLDSPSDGIITEETEFNILIFDGSPVSKAEIVSAEPEFRFREYFFGGTFLDLQYNFFRRQFILENEIFNPTAEGGHRFFSLLWIMKSKIFVKTPVIFYIRRNSPHSQTNEKNLSPNKVAKIISERIELSRHIDKILQDIAFFKDKDELRYKLKAQAFAIQDDFYLKRRGVYNKEFTKACRLAVEDVLKKYFGEDFFYPMFLFCQSHAFYDSSIGQTD